MSDKEPQEPSRARDPAESLPTRQKRVIDRTVVVCLTLLIFGACMVVRKCTEGPPPHPLSLQETLMCYDTSRQKMMLYATGYWWQGESASYETPSIWSWTGDHWRLEGKAAGVPGGRALCAYDPVNSRLVVYLLGQGATWILGDNGWARTKTQVEPDRWHQPGMFYSPREQRVQMLAIRVVWELLDDGWQVAHEHKWPIGSIEARPVYDAKYDRIVAYGSELGKSGWLSNVLWEVRGTEWKRLAKDVFYDPWREKQHEERVERGEITAIVYDEARKTLILIIGAYKAEHHRILEVVGEEVRSVRSVNPAPGRSFPTFCYNPKTNSIMMHGGQRYGYGSTYFNETWEIRYSPEQDIYVWQRLD